MCVAEEVGPLVLDTVIATAGIGLVFPIGSCVGTAMVKVSLPVMGVMSTGYNASEL